MSADLRVPSRYKPLMLLEKSESAGDVLNVPLPVLEVISDV